MKQGETGMSLRHAPGKFLVVGRFLEKIVSALLPFLTMLVSARFIDLVLNQRMEEAIRDACLLGALILCQRLGGNLDTWMRIHQRKVLFPYLDERMIGKISRIPYGFLENTEIQDALERVSKDPEEVLNGVLESGFSMVYFLISNGCLVVWLITQAPVWISPVIMVLLVGFMVYYLFQGTLHPHWLWWLMIPVELVHLGILGMGFGIIVSSMTTKYRDLTVLVDFGVSLWMYATPVVYPLSMLGEGWMRTLLQINPVTESVELMRYAILGQGTVNWGFYFLSWGMTLVIAVLGIMVFNKVERTFMDTV